jgi:hypothetical protein
MNRLKRELISRDIVYEIDDDDESEYGRQLVAITDKYIICCSYCLFLPSEIHLFDRNFNFLGSQFLFPDKWGLVRNNNKWCSFVKEESK